MSILNNNHLEPTKDKLPDTPAEAKMMIGTDHSIDELQRREKYLAGLHTEESSAELRAVRILLDYYNQ